MKKIFPAKLKFGDEIRVIAPARSMSIIKPVRIKLAAKRLDQMGFKVTFGENARRKDQFQSSYVKTRVADLHQAFRDKKVKMIIAALGGYNSNQLLDYLDYDLIRNNPKIICGYSDITALTNAVYARTGLVTYAGPNFSSFAEPEGVWGYMEEMFKNCFVSEKSFLVRSAGKWTESAWWRKEKMVLKSNPGMQCINPGQVIGTIVGGNTSTFGLLQGTKYMPSLENSILFIEEDDLAKEDTIREFDRNLQSLVQQRGFTGVRGIVIGRFQSTSGTTKKKLEQVIRSKQELKGLPVIAGADFGHTAPQFFFPIGGTARIVSSPKKCVIEILRH